MAYYGSWKIDDLLTFGANTHRFDTGAATDADSVPSYRVYEDETSTPILTGNMALLDSSNTAGFYSEQITLSAANGFEKGKSYTVYIQATVNSVTGATHHNFQIEAEVDANLVSNLGANVITAASIATGAIDADAIADNAIDAGAIASDAITAAKIADGAIDAATFATGAITAAAIAADAIGASELAADAVTEIQSGLATSANQTTILSRLGTPTDLGSGANLSANLVDIEGQTDDIGSAGAGLSAIPWNSAWDAEVQSEVQDAIEANNLDHLVGTATGIPSVPAGTYLDQIMDDGTANYDRTTDSLQAIRDRGDSAWDTADVSALALQASVDDLEGRLTAARAGYLDNLSAGAVATAASIAALNNISPAEVNAEMVDVVGTDVIPDSVAADGSRPTMRQALLMITRFLMEKSVSSTTVTVKKEDGSTSSMTFTLDNGTTPTSITRSS